MEIAADPLGPGYLEALGVRLVAGRYFDDRDVEGADRVAVVNEAAARELWPAQSALGRIVLHNEEPVRIVGVVGDVRRIDLEANPAPTLYLSSAQTRAFWTNDVLVRTSGDPSEIVPAVRAILRDIDPALPATRIQTLEARLAEVTAPRRFILRLVGLFSIVALLLAAIGIYGVAAEWVAQRVPEIGIRTALGASPAALVRMVLRQGSWMIALGVAIGTAAALALNGVMASFVFGVPTTDPVSFGAAVLAVTAAGLLACAIPARRASRVDPVIALRQE